MSINQKSGRQTFRRRSLSSSLFVSPCPPECNFQSETKIEPDLMLSVRLLSYISHRTAQHTNSSNILTPSLIILKTDQTEGRGKLLMESSLFEQGNPPLALWSIKASLVVIRLISFLGPGEYSLYWGGNFRKGYLSQSSGIGILPVEVYERVGKSVISVCKMT